MGIPYRHFGTTYLFHHQGPSSPRRRYVHKTEICTSCAVVLTSINTKLPLVKFRHVPHVFRNTKTCDAHRNQKHENKFWKNISRLSCSYVLVSFFFFFQVVARMCRWKQNNSTPFKESSLAKQKLIIPFFPYYFTLLCKSSCFLDLSLFCKCRTRTICSCLSLSSCFIQQLMVRLLSLLAPFAIVKAASNEVAREADQV
jgi:hypothetical protein